MLEPILQQVGAGNPQLAQLIGQNPDQFLQLLSEDADEDAPLPPGAQAISVTEEEREAIERVSNPTMSQLHLLTWCCSYVGLASRGIWSFRHTLHATKTRNWPQTFYSISLPKAMRHDSSGSS